MKRELKFRGLRNNGEWIYGGFCRRWNNKPCVVVYNPKERDDDPNSYEDDWEIYVDVYEDTIGQFTGLLDKNGKEIYEGDIITVNGNYPRVVLWDKMTWGLMPTEFYHDKYFWVMNLQHPGTDWWEEFADEFEIIGNIHDNPELIKE